MRTETKTKMGEVVRIAEYTGRIPEGKKFVCWNTREDGMGINYQPGQTVRVTGNIELHPVWGDVE